MKTLVKTSVIVLSLLTIFSCKEKNDETTDVTTVEEVSEIGFPNESDIHFDNAITALESNNAKKAAEELSKGVKTLSEEGKNLTGKGKTTLDNSIESLNKMVMALKNDETIAPDNLMETILNAEVAVGHDYLITDDLYLLTNPEKVEDKSIIDIFSKNMKQLENTDDVLQDDGDSMGQKLYREGAELEKQYNEWLAKVKDHNQRANEHIQNDFIQNTNIE
ncbi:MAG: hypothetical protein AB3N10_08850 [Allomuricauda sp.]|jgi:hypothetical protein|nr:MAG: hypothetical protein CBB72_015270 [Muricauda sp. TMED12]|tara:strand:+ start:58 stop:717 length:660 start_codon:yes stop_codon:yes gene_type:complete